MPDTYRAMSAPEIDAFLGGVRQAVISTSRRDGSPQMSPVWYLWEERQLIFATSPGTAKYRNLQRDPRIGVCVHAEHPDSRTVMLYGRAELLPPDSPEAPDIAWRVVRRYFDSDGATREYMDSTEWENNLAVVVLSPGRIVAQDWND